MDVQNESDMTPLHCACQADQSETVALLLDARADVKLVDKSNRTPYSLTKEGSKTRALLEARGIKK